MIDCHNLTYFVVENCVIVLCMNEVNIPLLLLHWDPRSIWTTF